MFTPQQILGFRCQITLYGVSFIIAAGFTLSSSGLIIEGAMQSCYLASVGLRCISVEHLHLRCTSVEHMYLRCTSVEHMHLRCTSVGHMHLRCTSVEHMHLRCTSVEHLHLHVGLGMGGMRCLCGSIVWQSWQVSIVSQFCSLQVYQVNVVREFSYSSVYQIDMVRIFCSS